MPGDTVEVIVAAKGGGSEAKSKFAMLNPSDSIVDWVLKTVPTMGAGWCPPGMLGIGIGGTAEKAMLMAKESLMEPIDIQELIARGPKNRAEELRIELYDKVNALGIGAQGLGGLTTVLDVKVKDYPTHAANLPVAMIPNCAATRHAHFVLDGSGPVMLDPPSLEDWPKLTYDASKARRVNLDTVTRDEVATLEARRSAAAQRQAAHRPRRRAQAHDRHAQPGRNAAGRFQRPLHLLRRPGRPGARRSGRPGRPHHRHAHGQVHPTDARRRPACSAWSAKPSAAPPPSRPSASTQSVYLMAVGGAAYLVSKAIKASRVVGFADLGMEAIYEFDVEDMPVTVAVDSGGSSVHQTGPREWQARIGKIPVVVK